MFRLVTQDAADQLLAPVYFASCSRFRRDNHACGKYIGGICRCETVVARYHLYYTSLIEELTTWQENDLKSAAAG